MGHIEISEWDAKIIIKLLTPALNDMTIANEDLPSLECLMRLAVVASGEAEVWNSIRRKRANGTH